MRLHHLPTWTVNRDGHEFKLPRGIKAWANHDTDTKGVHYLRVPRQNSFVNLLWHPDGRLAPVPIRGGSVDFDGSDDILDATFTAIADYPISMSCVFKPADVYGCLFSYADGGAANKYMALYIDGTLGGNPAGIDTRNTTNQELRTANGWTADTWNQHAGIWTSSSSRKAVLNGDFANQVTSGTTINFPADLSQEIGIGGLNRNTDADFVNADIGECGIWARAISDADDLALSYFYSPLFFPNDLLFYAPLIVALYDVIGALPVASAGGPVLDEHPAMTYPAGPIVISQSADGGVSTTITGVVATATAAALEGTIAAIRVASVAGEVATANAAVTEGSVATTRIVSVAGEVATATTAAPEGVITGVRITSIAGEVASASAAAAEGAVAAQVATSVSGEVATTTAAALQGAVLIATSVSGETAAATSAALVGVITALAIVSASVSGEAATATADVLVGSVSSNLRGPSVIGGHPDLFGRQVGRIPSRQPDLF